MAHHCAYGHAPPGASSAGAAAGLHRPAVPAALAIFRRDCAFTMCAARGSARSALAAVTRIVVRANRDRGPRPGRGTHISYHAGYRLEGGATGLPCLYSLLACDHLHVVPSRPRRRALRTGGVRASRWTRRCARYSASALIALPTRAAAAHLPGALEDTTPPGSHHVGFSLLSGHGRYPRHHHVISLSRRVRPYR